MLNPRVLLPIIKKSLPEATDQEILQGIADLEKKQPKLNDAQALAIFNTAMKHPQVQAAMQEHRGNDQVSGFLKKKGEVK